MSKQISAGGAGSTHGLLGLGGMLAMRLMSSTVFIDSEKLLVNEYISSFHILRVGKLEEDIGDWDPSYHSCVSFWD